MPPVSVNTPLLSILIPAHNWDVGALLDSLCAEILAHGLGQLIDLHLFDDASEATVAASNEASVSRITARGVAGHWHGSAVNLGRSAARNELIARSTGSHLLFLDADVMPDRSNFLTDYLSLARTGVTAACGGLSYAQCPHADADTRFYLRYSSAASVAPPQQRMTLPWAWLYTSNVLVTRSLVSEVPFDNGFVGYGYEDVEWGIRLAQTGSLVHVDNPVTHLGLLTKATLRRKMRESAPNLVRLASTHPRHAEQLRLVRTARGLSRLPAWCLANLAAIAGSAFTRLNGPYGLELAAFQIEKLLLGAMAFKQCR